MAKDKKPANKKGEDKKELLSRRVSRRDFLVGSGAVIAAGTLAASSPKITTATTTTKTQSPETLPYSMAPERNHPQELPLPKLRPLGTTEFNCDVLVMGASYAGIQAALGAYDAGMKVIVVDKGKPGRSGAGPWANTMLFYDERLGDDRDVWTKTFQRNTEYIIDQDYLDLFMEESLAAWKRWVDLGIVNDCYSFPTPKELTQYKMGLARPKDRRLLMPYILKDRGIQVFERVMLNKLLTDSSGAVAGAAGIYAESDEVLIFRAKAVIDCTGGGGFGSSGYPLGGLTGDGAWMAYHAGASISGKELEMWKGCSAEYPSDGYQQGKTNQLGRIYATQPPNIEPTTPCSTDFIAVHDVGSITREPRARDGIYPPDQLSPNYNYTYKPVDQSKWENVRYDHDGNHPPLTFPALASRTNPQPPDGQRSNGAAIGLSMHCVEGIFPADTHCWSGVPGLWAAGDALSSRVCGGAYSGKGVSTSSASVFGYHAAQRAAEYVKGISAPVVSADQIRSVKEELLAPLHREKGYTGNWVRELVLGTYAPYYIHRWKHADRIKGTLLNCAFMRDHICPCLIARNPHENRLAHEAKHMVLNLEMRLRSALIREESRGVHAREDFPYRDDKNWLAWTTCTKGSDGKMVAGKVPMPDRMKVDTDWSYADRYHRGNNNSKCSNIFPGEKEAIERLGIK